jgi:hypothetical protein
MIPKPQNNFKKLLKLSMTSPLKSMTKQESEITLRENLQELMPPPRRQLKLKLKHRQWMHSSENTIDSSKRLIQFKRKLTNNIESLRKFLLKWKVQLILQNSKQELMPLLLRLKSSIPNNSRRARKTSPRLILPSKSCTIHKLRDSREKKMKERRLSSLNNRLKLTDNFLKIFSIRSSWRSKLLTNPFLKKKELTINLN